MSFSTELIDGAAATDNDTADVHGPVVDAAGEDECRVPITAAVAAVAAIATASRASGTTNGDRCRR
jgi:hypothetical protein